MYVQSVALFMTKLKDIRMQILLPELFGKMFPKTFPAPFAE